MTNAERDFQDKIRQNGCIVCRLFLNLFSPCDIHHILRGARRIGEMDVLGLCQLHHRSGLCNSKVVSRHPYKTSFESRYGTEATLLAKTKELL